NGSGALAGSVVELQRRDVGIFADLTVGYRDFLYLNLTGRQDFTSTLAKGNNGYFYPSAGLSFILSEAVESIKNSNILSFAKLSISNSIVYNDLGAYQLNERYTQPENFPFPYGAVNGFELSGTTVDANIQKEKLNTIE